MDRSRALLPHALLVGAVLLLAAVGWPVAADAATARVDVASYDERTEAFRPKGITVHPDDTVRWVWTADEAHTVSFDPVPGTEGGDGSRCFLACKGHTYAVTFPDLGDFPYTDHVTGATGVVHVVEPPEDDPTDAGSPDATEDPGGDSSEQPSEDQQTSPPADDDADGQPTPDAGADTTTADRSGSSDGTTEDADAAPRSGTSGSVGADVVDRQTPEATSEGPAVAAAEPDFLEEFPAPRAPTPSEDVGEVALPDDAGGVARTVWGTIGGLSLLGTIGAFGRVVLLADPWAA